MTGKIKAELLTLKEAADHMGKSVHNVSYLITYGRIKKLNKEGKHVKYVGRGQVHVSKTELDEYIEDFKRKLAQRRKALGLKDETLAFYHLSERERTKHVHRLHPYIGKFIPQLVEEYVKNEFSKNALILDPFMGSGTTLVASNELGRKSVGIDISPFNCMISRAKLENYNLDKVKSEILDILERTKDFSDSWTRST